MTPFPAGGAGIQAQLGQPAVARIHVGGGGVDDFEALSPITMFAEALREKHAGRDSEGSDRSDRFGTKEQPQNCLRGFSNHHCASAPALQ